MTDTSIVQFEYLPPIKVWIPSPRADKVGNSLRTMRAEIDAALSALRHVADADLHPIKFEVLAEALHEATRPMRRAERAHVAQWVAEVQARQFGADTDPLSETPDDEPSPEFEA